MKLGEKIKEIRKENNLSQEQFAEQFKVTRQTVSSWENEKSYPDLETIIKLSDDFKIPIDELLKGDQKIVKQIDSEKKQKKRLLRVLIVMIISTLCLLLIGVFIIKKANSMSFEMKRDKTEELTVLENQPLSIETGYFTLPKKSKVTIKLNGDIDTGQLKVIIVSTEGNQKVYQIKNDQINDEKQIYLEKGSYEIQITADDYQEKVISYSYQLKLSN